MKQTAAVEWLYNELSKYVIYKPTDLAEWKILKELTEKAKAMDKHDKPKLNKILKNLQDSNYLPAMDDDTRDTLISLIKETL